MDTGREQAKGPGLGAEYGKSPGSESGRERAVPHETDAALVAALSDAVGHEGTDVKTANASMRPSKHADTAAKAHVPRTSPSRTPPDEIVGEIQLKALQSNKHILALRSAMDPRNAWIHIDGEDWKELYNGSDTTLLVLTILCSAAKQTRGRVDYREGSDGMIRELYVW